MKPPSRDAISKALDILLESVLEQNGYPFPSSHTVPLDDIPFEELATHADVLNSAKSSLAKEADELISRIQHRRNLAAPIHRLPEEIFETIFEMTETCEPAADIRDLLLFSQVGRLWHATISSAPQLWTRIDTNISPTMAQKMVISLSNGLPLSLLWNVVNPGGRYCPMLDIVVQNSTRFKSMDLRVGLSKPLDIKRLLTSPTPALESLTVGVNQVPSIFWSWDGPEVEEFALSEGAPLKHLNLKDFTLTMESHRFSNLITLFLDGSAVPGSLGTLLQILRTSAQLEQLTISNDTQRDEAHQSSPLITLPRLKNLKIDRITVDYCMSLLASIHAPACSQAYVQDEGLSDHAESLDALVWQPEGIQAAALLGFTSSSPESPISGVPATVSITTTISVSHNVTVVRVKDKDGFRSRYLAFRRREPLKLLKRIGESLLHLLYPSSSSLVDFRLMFPHDLLDLRPWSSTLESLKLPGYAASLSAMEQLGQCIATPSGNGAVATESWMCPNLQDITLHMPEEEEEECAIYIAALRSLVRKRWSGEDGDLAPAIQPNRFLIISPRYKEFQDVQSEIQRVLPFFTFNWG